MTFTKVLKELKEVKNMVKTISTKEFAKKFNCSESSARKYCKENLLTVKAFKDSSNKWCIPENAEPPISLHNAKKQ